MPTIKDVAREAGVSIATVSYVLNDRHEMVGEQTRLHVLEIAHRLGYKANSIARSLQSSRTNLIGYSWHTNPTNEPNPVLDQFIYNLAHCAEAAEYHLLTFTHPYAVHAPLESISVYERLIDSGRVDGFVLAETTYDDPRIAFLIKKQFPFVSFGRANPDWAFNWIDTDGQAGMFAATQHLLALGHERIAFLGWPKESLTGNYRLAGFMDAMQSAHLPVPEHFIVHNEYKQNSVEKAFRHWRDLPLNQRPTAVAAVTDYVASTAMRTAVQFDYRIGETMSVVGFDDAPFVRYLHPPLTTVRQRLAHIADRLVRRLHQVIQQPGEAVINQLIEPELIVRGSSGPPRVA